MHTIPVASMYGIFTYIHHKNQPNVGKYTIHWCYGILTLTKKNTWKTPDTSYQCREGPWTPAYQCSHHIFPPASASRYKVCMAEIRRSGMPSTVPSIGPMPCSVLVLRLAVSSIKPKMVLLMEKILHHLGCKKLVNNGRNYLSTGAGFLPSTVPSIKRHQTFIQIHT